MGERDAAGLSDQEAGVYTWEVAADILYADTAVATLFGLDPVETVKGLPLAAYIARVHPDDQPTLLSQISESVKNGLSYHFEYRVIDRSGRVTRVMGLGRSFHDTDSGPAHCTGIVYPIDRL